jgi:NAD(P)H dehydrogenase (quinone)
MIYAITGATGHVGSVAADLLLQKGLPVRAILRRPEKAGAWKKKGAETMIANLLDVDALAKAFQAAAGVFIMTPPLLDAADPMSEHRQMLTALGQALTQARPKKIVYLSSIGAQHAEGTGAIRKLYEMEQVFRQLPVPTVGIRAGWFMENFSGAIASAKESGRLISFLNPIDYAIPMIATGDIGRLVATLLQQSWAGHRLIELEGPCRYSAEDVAGILGYLLRRPVEAYPLPEQDYEAAYRSFGASPAGAAMLSEMNRGFNSRLIDFEKKGNERAKGETLLEDNLKKYVDLYHNHD